MCQFCSGNGRIEIPREAEGDGQSDKARLALSNDADLAKPPAAGDAQQKPADAKDSPGNDPRAILKEKYGVEVREVKGAHEFYYRAGGIDNVVLRTGADKESLSSAPGALDAIVKARMTAIERAYKISFIKPGEWAAVQHIEDDQCRLAYGDKVYTRPPTLPFLYGFEEGLKHAQPSQMTASGKEGVRIYLLDKQHRPDFYGGRKIQGTYTPADKDGKPAVYFSPAGQELPPTSRDVAKPGDRSVAWITGHEVNHNSQETHWGLEAPDSAAQAMGWEITDQFKESFGSLYNTRYLLKGKNGEYYRNGNDSCKEASSWFKTNAEGAPLSANGQIVERVGQAERFTNEQIMDKALVRPSTFYFMTPIETMAEAMTAFKHSRESRGQLFLRSPELYNLTKQYDQEEIARYYGTTFFGSSAMTRNPDGIVVPNSYRAIAELSRFEAELQRAAAGVDVTKR